MISHAGFFQNSSFTYLSFKIFHLEEKLIIKGGIEMLVEIGMNLILIFAHLKLTAVSKR